MGHFEAILPNRAHNEIFQHFQLKLKGFVVL